MPIITLKSASRTITIAASLLCIGGIASYFKSAENTKSIALNIALMSGAIAGVNILTSSYYEQSANEQCELVTNKQKKKIAELKSSVDLTTAKCQEQSVALAEFKVNSDKAQQEIEAKAIAVAILQQQVTKIRADFSSRAQELQDRLDAKDTRFEELLEGFKGQLIEDLSQRIYYVYNGLSQSITHKLNSQDYQKIHPQLQKFYDSLEGHYTQHCHLLREIKELENNATKIVQEAIDIYSQINDEISALRVKLRNILNIDERQSLDDCYTLLAEFKQGYTPVNNAKNALSQLSDYQKQQLQNLNFKIDDNENSLSEMRNQVNDLIDHIEAKNLEINNLKQQIAALKRPRYWYSASRDDLKVANIIIEFYESCGLTLDRASSEYHKWYAVLSFHIDRTGRSVLTSELNEHSERIQQLAHTFNIPEFKYDGETGLISTWVQIAREPEKPLEDPVVEVKKFLQPVESLIGFVRDAYHVGLWAETGGGKSTAIANVIGGMVQALGGSPTIRTTIPKIDADTAKIFPRVDWLGIPESIFGLLEAALEIQYRIWVNEQAFRAGEEIKDFTPILFFIDEINLIFTRWGSLHDSDLENVLQRFEDTLQGERLEYFKQNMITELTNYKKEFAKRLLLFIWQTGRSLRVKSLIAGQNLQPGSFGFKVNDLANCAYISFGDSIRTCAKYKVRDVDSADNTKQYNLVQKALASEPSFKYVALYCPTQGKSFYGILPPPNYYEWESSLLRPKTSDNTLDNLDGVQTNVQTRPTVDTSYSNTFGDFLQMSKLPLRFQNLPYEGYVQLWKNLPKKADGSVHKTQAYERVFRVKRSEERKVVSDFIDYLQQNFK